MPDIQQNTSPAPTLTIADAMKVATSPTEPVLGDAQTTTENPANSAKDESLSSRFAALARKQKLIEQEKQKLKAEKTGFDSERAEYTKWKEDQGKPKAKKTPLQALMDEGYSYEDATNFIMNDNKPTPELMVRDVESKMDKFIREQEEKEAQRANNETETQKAAEAKAISDFKTSIKGFITDNADAYELIGLHEAQELIFDTISAHYEQTSSEGNPKILSTKEAADMVESYLEEQVQKSMDTKKLKAKLAQLSPTVNSNTPAMNAFTANKTLSNSVTTSSSSTKVPAKNDDERMQRAIALLKK